MPNGLLRREPMKENGNRTYLTQGLSCWISDIAFSRFRSFCNHVLGVRIGEFPSEQSIFMRQNFSIILCAAVLYLLTNGFYLVKHIIQKTMIPIDMIPLYMMVAASLAMLLFLALCKKYDSPLARFALLGYYTMIIASVTIFMVSCNFHGIGLSISMCYLFVIMIAPTYKTLDTVIICVLIVLSWWLPSRLPYAENYDLFKHFLLRFSIIVGFIAIRSIFLRQSRNERSIKEMTHSFIKLAYNDVMTGTLNRKAMETYCAFTAEKLAPETVSVFLCQVGTKKILRIYKPFIGGQPPVNGLRFLYALLPFFVRRFLYAAANASIIGVTGNSLSGLDRYSNRMPFSLNFRSNLMKEEASRLIREASRVRIATMP